jgi:hypothetical protein
LWQILVHKTTDQRSLWRISGAENANAVEAVVDSATNKDSSRVGWLAGWLAISSSSSNNNNNKNTFLYLLTSPAKPTKRLSELLHMKLSAVVSRQGSSLPSWVDVVVV